MKNDSNEFQLASNISDLILINLNILGSLTSSQLAKITRKRNDIISRNLSMLIKDGLVLYKQKENFKSMKLFFLSKRGKRKISAFNINNADNAAWNVVEHKDAIIEFIVKNNLNANVDVLTERTNLNMLLKKEKISDEKKFFSTLNKNFSRRPDLVSTKELKIFDGENEITVPKNAAIEIEINFKNKKDYLKIFKEYSNFITNRQYSQVCYFCTDSVFKKFMNYIEKTKKIILPFYVKIYKL